MPKIYVYHLKKKKKTMCTESNYNIEMFLIIENLKMIVQLQNQCSSQGSSKWL